MAHRIWKYRLHIKGGEQEFGIPEGATVLYVGKNPQDYSLAVWVDVPDSTALAQKRLFEIIGTGHEVPAGTRYLGTVVLDEFAWHILEVIP